MKIFAKIAHAGQGRARLVRLGKGANRIILQPGETIDIIDEATGLPVHDAQWAQADGHVTIALASAGISVAVEGAGVEANDLQDGAAAASSGQPPADASPSADGEGGGGNG
ncbi:hypothetical protein, partial [Sphingomonas sp. SCN 67-18]|uniref:hypothetical protein n=1 Tax=uncultured Sphingomonas sp. TaxID=158754 RepID=UPI0025E64325